MRKTTMWTQLEDVKNKDDMHRWIDDLPDEAEIKGMFLLMVREPDESVWYSYKTCGGPTRQEENWIIDSFKHWVLFTEET